CSADLTHTHTHNPPRLHRMLTAFPATPGRIKVKTRQTPAAHDKDDIIAAENADGSGGAVCVGVCGRACVCCWCGGFCLCGVVCVCVCVCVFGSQRGQCSGAEGAPPQAGQEPLCGHQEEGERPVPSLEPSAVLLTASALSPRGP